VSNAAGRLFIVATPIGNRDDITLRAIEVLRDVDRVVAEDTRHSRRLLDHLGVRRPMLSLHEHNEDAAAKGVVGRLLDGETLALISDAGTPLISDPGYGLVRACREQGIEVVPVPGPNAAICALSVAGLPTDRFLFEGFPARRSAARRERFATLRNETATLVFYEAAHRIAESLADMAAVFGDDRRATLARELTKLHETVRMATLGELRDWVDADPDQRRGEFVVVVAGSATPQPAGGVDVDEVLRVLLDELPLKQAAGLAARITGGKRNELYRRALELSRD